MKPLDRALRRGILGLTLLMAACAVGPNYKRPSAPVPSEYKEQAALQAPTPTGEWKPAEPKDDLLRGNWWEIFGDPELNLLEERIDVSNQNIAQVEAQFRGARAAVRGARADFLPTVTASPSATRSQASANRATSFSATSSGKTVTDYLLPVDLSYEADIWGRVRRNVESGVANAQASAADLETVRLTMHAELASDYLQLRGVDAERRLLESNVTAFETALQLTINRHNQGIVSGVDVAQAETLLYTTRAQLTDLGVARSQLEHAIAILIGKPPGDFAIPSLPIVYTPPPIPVGLPSDLLERRPEIAAAERRVASANAQIGVATAAFFPRLLLAASGGYESANLATWFSLPSRFWSVGPSLAATLFDGGKRRAATEQARAAYDGTVAAYRLNVLTAFQEVEDNLAALRILAQESAQQEEAVAAAERSLTLARNRYGAGITTYLEVITAQSATLSDARVAIDILTRRLTASVNLIKALGGGWRTSDLPYGGAPAASQAPEAGGAQNAGPTQGTRPQP
jgi:NodT family efflux transporter outer membrane factor (OMF) lipoprotein